MSLDIKMMRAKDKRFLSALESPSLSISQCETWISSNNQSKSDSLRLLMIMASYSVEKLASVSSLVSTSFWVWMHEAWVQLKQKRKGKQQCNPNDIVDSVHLLSVGPSWGYDPDLNKCLVVVESEFRASTQTLETWLGVESWVLAWQKLPRAKLSRVPACVLWRNGSQSSQQQSQPRIAPANIFDILNIFSHCIVTRKTVDSFIRNLAVV